jgi:hypothetical protein
MGAAQAGKRINTMAVTITEGITKRMVGISCEEDLKLSPGFLHINPPPADGKCDCCGKHLNELKPFSVVGHASGVDIEEALLVKKFRRMAPPDEEVDKIIEEFFGGCLNDEDEKNAEERLIEVYGKENAENLLLYVSASSCVTANWECRECMALDTESYFEMQASRYSQDHGDLIPLNRDGMLQPHVVLPITGLLREG